MNTLSSPLLGLSQRLPPSNLQAEQALLGALLANNKAYERVSEFLLPTHFADPIHGRIFQAIQRRAEAGQLADAVTLKAATSICARPSSSGSAPKALLTTVSPRSITTTVTGDGVGPGAGSPKPALDLAS